MKFVCDACSRLVEVAEFSVREGSLILVCPTCGQESLAAPDRKPAPVLELARPKPPPQGPLCPKCGAPRVEATDACAKCGLVYALFKPETLALSPALEELWTAVEANWTDVGRHEAFLSACTASDQLTDAARRYRVRAEQTPGDALASRFRDEAASRVMATAAALPLSHDAKGDRPDRIKLVAAIALFLASMALFFYVLVRLMHPPS
jgi:predicted RNA-binding Zn-ribbon protein involved in translation (DUF1610 family)